MNIIWKVCYINGTKDFNHDLWNPDDIAFVIYHCFVTTELLQVLHTATYFVIITVRNEVAKVMFLQACVCPHGGCLPQCMLGYYTPGADTPGSRHPPGADTPPEQTPPIPERHPLLWTVRILLECILVAYLFRVCL